VGNLNDKVDKILNSPYLGRWLAGGAIFTFFIVFAILRWTWARNLAQGRWLWIDTLFLALLGVLGFLAFDRLLDLIENQRMLRNQLEISEGNLEEASRRQKALTHISQLFADARDEEEVMELILHLSMDLLQAEGASFVPLDEYARPQSAKSMGRMPFPAPEAWAEYLASPEVREKCSSCNNYEELTHVCPLLKEPLLDAVGVYCLPIQRGEQEYGILNLYLPKHSRLDDDTQNLIRTILDETSLALEAVRLRKRAMSALRQIQAVHEKTDLRSMLIDLVESLHKTLEADYALVSEQFGMEGNGNEVSSGQIPENARPLLTGIIHSVIATKEPVILGNVSGDTSSSAGIRSLMAVPLISQEQSAFGVLLLANKKSRAFNHRQLTILQTIASQVAFLVQNVSLMAKLEYKAMVEERARLAREIHDGLAQTLGFLKLKTAQIRNYLENADTALARETIDTLYEVLDEAYQDARQAIDGLRIASIDESLAEMLRQIASEYETYIGIPVQITESDVKSVLPSEVTAQLIRIVQEALSNIRKHAQANKVDISISQRSNDLIIDVSDDGVGFWIEDVTGTSKHGLRGMRERAELIGADFQVASRPHTGTTVSVRLPLQTKETIYETDHPGRS